MRQVRQNGFSFPLNVYQLSTWIVMTGTLLITTFYFIPELKSQFYFTTVLYGLAGIHISFHALATATDPRDKNVQEELSTTIKK